MLATQREPILSRLPIWRNILRSALWSPRHRRRLIDRVLFWGGRISSELSARSLVSRGLIARGMAASWRPGPGFRGCVSCLINGKAPGVITPGFRVDQQQPNSLKIVLHPPDVYPLPKRQRIQQFLLGETQPLQTVLLGAAPVCHQLSQDMQQYRLLQPDRSRQCGRNNQGTLRDQG